MIDIHKLQQFVTLARIGNFTRASAELNLSQSALSRSMQSLEAQLGARLLERERGKSGVTLTQAGRELFGRVQALLEQIQALETSVSGTTPRIVRKLGFGLGPMAASALLTEVLRAKLVSDPDLAVTVFTDTSDFMTGLLLDGEIEFYLGLASPRRQTPRIQRRLFTHLSAQLYVRPGHPLVEQDEVTTDDVLRFPLISGTAWNETLTSLSENDDRYLFATTIQVDNYSILAGIAAESDAVMISSFVRPGDRLVQLHADTSLTRGGTEYYVFSLAGVPLSPAAEAMIRDLRDRCDEVFGTSPESGYQLPEPI
jgi:DNA-binding transcriptional LysR family regulator